MGTETRRLLLSKKTRFFVFFIISSPFPERGFSSPRSPIPVQSQIFHLNSWEMEVLQWEPGRGERAALGQDFSNIRYFRRFEMVPVFYVALHVNSFSSQPDAFLSKHRKGNFSHFRLVLSIKTQHAPQETCRNLVCPAESWSFIMKNSFVNENSS